MLKIVQFLAVAAAFFLPWTVGTMITSFKAANRKKFTRFAIICALDVLFLSVCIALAFALNK